MIAFENTYADAINTFRQIGWRVAGKRRKHIELGIYLNPVYSRVFSQAVLGLVPGTVGVDVW